MKRLIKRSVLVALALFALIGLYSVNAAWTIRQNGDGSTDFVPTNSTLEAARVGSRTLSYNISNINVSASHYILSPITGRLKQVFFVADNGLVSAITISVFLDRSGVTGAFTALAPTARHAAGQATGYGTNILEHFFMKNDPGQSSTLTNDSEWVSYGTTGFTNKATVKKGRPIVVRIDNGLGATNYTAVSGSLQIVIDPE